MKKINLIITILLSFYAQLTYADITITVTSTSFSELEDAIEDAVDHAESGSGETATIILNAGGLIPINAPLPDISHTNGRVIIKKNDSDPDNEGLIAVAGAWPFDKRYGFRAIGSSHIEIRGLVFKDFNAQPTFSDYKSAIGFHNVSSLRIVNCEFNNCEQGMYVNYHGDNLTDNVEITGNVLNNCTYGIGYLMDDYVSSTTHFSSDIIKVNDNDLTDCKYGIDIRIAEPNILASFEVNENELENLSNISSSKGIMIRNARKGYFECDLNQVTRFESGIWCGNDDGGFSSGDFGIDFIKTPNTLLLPEDNGRNTITNCELSFDVRSHPGNHFDYNIVAYTVEGSIQVLEDYSTSLRENIITASADWDYSKPIILERPSANNGIQSPIPVDVDYLGTDLDIVYSTEGIGLLDENGPFVVEFFELDADKSVLQYIGNQSVALAEGASYSIEFLDKVLSPGSDIGLTITSLGTNVSAYKIGTSEMAVSSVTDIQIPCETCEKFSPTPGERYWMSAWVNVDHDDQVKAYENVSVQLMAFGGETSMVTATPTGEIIDGWQRIVTEFTIPATSEYFRLRLNAHPTIDTYFDDIRIHPFNGSMKSYVYDGETFWLTSELDDNNYATFYEYDEEGGLVRIKKETARGIVTIQETRSNTIKE